MVRTVIFLAVFSLGADAPPIDGRALFALFERHHAAFRDVSLRYESSLAWLPAAGEMAGEVRRLQGLYVYRFDGATLRDEFGIGGAGRPTARTISTVLKNRLHILDASPDLTPAVKDREPETGPGGPGVLSGPNSPERLMLDYYYPTLGDPAEHDLKILGWEDVAGHRCLKVHMLRQPRPLLKGWVGPLRYIKLWVDVERDGVPLRYELLSGDDIEVRAEVTKLEAVRLPSGRALWMPVAGKVWTFYKQTGARMSLIKEPTTLEEIGFLVATIKFDQKLPDGFFSVKKQALVSSDETLRKLQRQLDSVPKPVVKRQPADPQSRQKRLDDALADAERQSSRLEASSAARAGSGWFEVLYGSLGLAGIALVAGAAFYRWRSG